MNCYLNPELREERTRILKNSEREKIKKKNKEQRKTDKKKR